MYEFVYSSIYSLAVVILLLASFVLQGIESVYASELEVTEEVVEEEIEESVEIVEEEVVEGVTEETEEEEVTEETEEAVEKDKNANDASAAGESKGPVDGQELADEAIEEERDEVGEGEADQGGSKADTKTNTEVAVTEDGVDVEAATGDDDTTSTAGDEEEVVGETEDQGDVATSSVPVTDAGTTTTDDTVTNDTGSTTSPVTDNENTTTETTGGGGSDNETGTSTTASTTEDVTVEEGQDSATEQNNDQSEMSEEDSEVIDNESGSDDGDHNSSANDGPTETADEEQATTTGEILGVATTSVLTESSTYLTHDNEYVFDKTACVAVGGGTYHCSTDSGVLHTINEQVFSERGSKGNYEIFIRTDDGVKKITDNDYEDSSPKYDEGSKRLVWQRLIDGRYHIIVYDLKDEEEHQLTSGSKNHMEPAIAGDNVVWQEWDGSDWEIVLYDGKETKQLTDNNVQDLAPVIEDEYVVWTTVGKDEQLVYVYSLRSGAMQTITDHEGGAIANPRFVLVYDTKFDNGDIITKGFDPETGLSSSLAATPGSSPIDDIPPPDSTGETKALIQNKSPQREDFSELEIDNSEPSNANATNTSATFGDQDQGGDLVIASTTDQVPPSEPLVLTEFDLVIDDQKTPTTTEDVQEMVSATTTST